MGGGRLKQVVILTGNELRHQYFRKKIALKSGIKVLKTYCESAENLIEKGAMQVSSIQRERHLLSRAQSEKDFFEAFTNTVEDLSNAAVINRGEINDICFEEITALNPDLVIVYGASILQEPLLSAFSKRILNVHLGLSPYYRGAATNFWPLVDRNPACVGATFMYIDAGIDTGEIIHQVRASYNFFDTPSTIGNRLIKDMTEVFAEIIIKYDSLIKPGVPAYSNFRKFFKKRDFTENSVEQLYLNFREGMIEAYLDKLDEHNGLFPIVTNKAVIN
ncbi:MAG: formyltransferase [Segetibacter sp.]|nr:formyltransferase [Segetibacter sp.]